ncbi:MAG: membrane protein insertion efficiency factor YidD [Smithellaceae bacterium]|nr:membrane protein insertion efficiency factor YidD [Smithellaceae bacterium]HBJ75562.1 membrane protein insertion efficiency factor YidD [Syntrophaceae bacterium]MDD5414193.1 membrane protein insertion efficiency factor YidD [Smithellaceae bacterium]HBL52652.1 membrane protein insertion efficiency factor YidD [Syntrophaceae bacterium]HCS77389.1 membrane protein insertion efficiency factor YidD [Syntrophaceae bacterium]
MLRRTLVNVFVFIIRLYQACISPFFFAPSCRFHPSCSQYAIDAVKLYGPVKGSYLGAKRILRCNPLHPGGYDPVK